MILRLELIALIHGKLLINKLVFMVQENAFYFHSEKPNLLDIIHGQRKTHISCFLILKAYLWELGKFINIIIINCFYRDKYGLFIGK